MCMYTKSHTCMTTNSHVHVHVVWCTVNVYNVSNFCVYSIIRLVVDFHIHVYT